MTGRHKAEGHRNMLAFDMHVLAGLFRDYRGAVLLLTFLSVPQVAEGIFMVRLSEYLTNEVFRITDEGFQGFLAGVALFLALLLGIKISGWVFDRVYNGYDRKVSIHANEALLDKISKIKYGYFEDTETYQDIYMAGEAPSCYVEMLFLLKAWFQCAFMLIVYLIIVSRYHMYYAMAVAVAYLFLGVAVKISTKSWDRFYEKNVVAWQRKELYFEGILSNRINHSNIQINRQLPFFAGRYEESADMERKNTLKFNLMSAMIQLLSGLVFTVVSVCILVAVMMDVASGRLEIGAVTAVCTILFSALSYIRGLVDMFQQNYKYRKAIMAYERVMALEEALQEGVPVPDQKGSGLAIEEIWYAYRQGQPVIKGLSGCFARGEKVAVVGENGSGKTTLMQLLLGLLEQ